MFPKHQYLRWVFNIYPPYLGAGIRVRHIAPDFREIRVEMVYRFWNKNYVGTTFGGSMASMADPFYMLMLLENLGRDYIVWDKKSTIHFKRPGTGSLFANFSFSEEEIRSIKEKADTSPKYEPTYIVQIKNQANEVVAEVEKTLYIKKKAPKQQQQQPTQQ
jgi:hypothetical protein